MNPLAYSSLTFAILSRNHDVRVFIELPSASAFECVFSFLQMKMGLFCLTWHLNLMSLKAQLARCSPHGLSHGQTEELFRGTYHPCLESTILNVVSSLTVQNCLLQPHQCAGLIINNTIQPSF